MCCLENSVFVIVEQSCSRDTRVTWRWRSAVNGDKKKRRQQELRVCGIFRTAAENSPWLQTPEKWRVSISSVRALHRWYSDCWAVRRFFYSHLYVCSLGGK
jgi:hypothetical protein